MSGFQGCRKLTTSEALNLDIKNMNIKRDVNFNNNITWKNGSNIGLKKLNEYEVALYYSNTVNGTAKNYDYEIGLDYTACNYGGERVWFICPDCGERVRKLYLRGGVFRCRSCQNLNYIIQQEDKRDYVMRSIDHKMYKIQDRLKTKRERDNIFCIEKPKGMHYKIYNELMEQLRNLYIQRENTFVSIAQSYKTGLYKNMMARLG